MGGRARTALAGAAIVALVLAVMGAAVAVVPFHDTGVACGPPIVAAVSGKTVVEVPGAAPHVVSKAFASRLPAFGIPGDRVTQGLQSNIHVACRTPARGRMIFAVSALVAAGLLVLTARSSRRRRVPAPTFA
jgi:hypothetical protein